MRRFSEGCKVYASAVWLACLAAIGVAGAAAGAVWMKRDARTKYRASRSILADNEASLYDILRQSVAEEYVVLPKVAARSVFDVRGAGGLGDRRLKDACFDFLVCRKGTLEPVLGVLVRGDDENEREFRTLSTICARALFRVMSVRESQEYVPGHIMYSLSINGVTPKRVEPQPKRTRPALQPVRQNRKVSPSKPAERGSDAYPFHHLSRPSPVSAVASVTDDGIPWDENAVKSAYEELVLECARRKKGDR